MRKPESARSAVGPGLRKQVYICRQPLSGEPHEPPLLHEVGLRGAALLALLRRGGVGELLEHQASRGGGQEEDGGLGTCQASDKLGCGPCLVPRVARYATSCRTCRRGMASDRSVCKYDDHDLSDTSEYKDGWSGITFWSVLTLCRKR